MPIGGVACVEGGAIGVPIGGVALIVASSMRGVRIIGEVEDARDDNDAWGGGGMVAEIKDTRSENALLHSLPPSPAPDLYPLVSTVQPN